MGGLKKPSKDAGVPTGSTIGDKIKKHLGNAMNLSAKRKKRMARSNDYLATPDNTFDFAPTPRRGGYQG